MVSLRMMVVIQNGKSSSHLGLQPRLVPAILSDRVFLITDDLWLYGAELNLRKRRRVPRGGSTMNWLC